MHQSSQEKQTHRQKNRYTQFSRNKNTKQLKLNQAFSLHSQRTRSTKFRHCQQFSRYDNANRQQNRSLRSLRLKEKEIDKNKFAEEYSKITSEFKNLLLRNLRTQRNLTQHNVVQQDDVLDSTNKVLTSNTHNLNNMSKSQYKLQFFKNRNKKLERLYIDKSHQEILMSTKRLNNNLTNAKDKQLIIHFQEEKQKKINQKFQFVPELLQHFNNLYGIRQLLEDYKNNYELIIRRIKRYVLSDNGADITKLDQFLKIQKEQENIRFFLCLQKILIIGLLDSLVREKFIEYEAKLTIQCTLEVYYSILTYIKSDKLGQHHKKKIKQILEQLNYLQLQKRKDLQSTIDFILKKVPIFYRYNQTYFAKIKTILEEAKANKFKINRCFYYILSQYAINLNESQEILTNQRNLLDTFLTCPSPHLPFGRVKGNITVVIQLQNCLGLTRGNNKYKIKMRPYAYEFLSQLNNICEVIIQTTLIPESFAEVPKIMDGAHSILYRYHCIRYRGHLLKDVSRLGRKIQSIIIVDSQPDNVTHKQNLLQIHPWKGNPLDQQLISLKKLLIDIIQQNPDDIRNSLQDRINKHSLYKITPSKVLERAEQFPEMEIDQNHKQLENKQKQQSGNIQENQQENQSNLNQNEEKEMIEHISQQNQSQNKQQEEKVQQIQNYIETSLSKQIVPPKKTSSIFIKVESQKQQKLIQ